jgi:ATP-dependent exoDNAse (exonuclease V) beta subunit
MPFKKHDNNLILKRVPTTVTTLTTNTPNLSHDQLQQKCFLWAYGTYPHLRKLFWHTPNELPKRPGESQKAYVIRLNQRKAIGVVAGVLDLVFYHKGKLYAFDFKVGQDRISEDQQEFISRIVEQGGEAYEIRTFDQFKSIFLSIIDLKE